MQQSGINSIFFHQPMDHIGHIFIIKADSGNIHRYWKRLFPFVQPFTDALAGMFPHIPVQLGNKSIALKDWYKIPRRHHPFPLHMPAHQYFSAVQPVFAQIVFRLDIQLELFICKCLLHRIDNLLFLNQLLCHGIVIECVIFYVIALTLLRRQIGPVADRHHLLFRMICRTDPKDRHQNMIDRILVDLVMHFFDHPHHGRLPLIRHAKTKHICPVPAIRKMIRFPGKKRQPICNILQQTIRLIHSIKLVHQMELINVQMDKRKCFPRISAQHLLRPAQKRLAVINASQFIIFPALASLIRYAQ